MKRRATIIAASVAFLVGLSIAPAAAAWHWSSWVKIFGHSTSCALGGSAINPETKQALGRTVNREGCSTSAPGRAVPPRRMYVTGYLFYGSSSPGRVCSAQPEKWNATSAAQISVAANLATSSYCPPGGPYATIAGHIRISDALDGYTKTTGTSFYGF